jgi:hypothetical protein
MAEMAEMAEMEKTESMAPVEQVHLSGLTIEMGANL